MARDGRSVSESTRSRKSKENHTNLRRAPVSDGRVTLLTLRQVMKMTGLGKSSIYKLMSQGQFPRPVRVGNRAVRWVEHEVWAYICSRPRAGSERLS